MLKLKPSLVIFDCDGVLVDSEPLANTILTRHLGRAGIELSEAQVQGIFRGCSAAMCPLYCCGGWPPGGAVPSEAAADWL